jgi:DNA-binding response OmpR family regulator
MPDPISSNERLKARHKILIADEDSTFARQLCDFLTAQGFETRFATNVEDSRELMEFWQPETVFVSLLLPVTNGLALLKFAQSGRLRKVPRMIVMSKPTQSEAADQVKRAGAAHFLVKPFIMEEAIRAISLSNASADADSKAERPNVELGPSTIRELHLLNLFLRQASTANNETGLFNLMRMITLKVKAIRCSLIQIVDEERGRVLASNDDENLNKLEIDLRNYPEVREVHRTLSHVVVANVKSSELLRGVQARLSQTPFETIVLFPVFRCGTLFGVLSLRMQQRDSIEIFYVEKFGQVCAQILSLAIATPGQRLVAE